MATLSPHANRRTVLITGFDAFAQVTDNPTAHLARRLSGRRVAHHTVVGRVLPVSYERGLDQGVSLLDCLSPALVVGLGVHRGAALKVETVARNAISPRADVDGIRPSDLGDGPSQLTTTLNAARIAQAMGADVSTDAGSYLCNAWLYTLLRHGASPGIFVHVPPGGVAIERLVAGVQAALGDPALRGTDLRRV